MYLTANFKVDLPGNCLVTWPEDETINLETKIKEFDVKVHFILENRKAKLSKDENWTYVLHQIHVRVSREEKECPPCVIPDSNGQKDYSIQYQYFDQKLDDYSKIASEATNHIIRFFKYKLFTPFLRELSPDYYSFRNAEWTDVEGNIAGKGIMTFVAKRGIAGLFNQLSVTKLTKNNVSNLLCAFNKPFEKNLHEELFSDAQSAIFEGNDRRGILELAIGCEILTKRTFFYQDTPAGAAFDYFEDKSLVKIRVIDLIHNVAKEAFGRSFKDDHPIHYKNIDHLYRCRNKIAHRGVLNFRDDSGNFINVDGNVVGDWWNAIFALSNWLKECTNEISTTT